MSAAPIEAVRKPRLPHWLSVPVLVCLPIALVLIVLFVAGAPLALPLSIIPFVIVAPVLWWLDRVEPETTSSKVHAFLWGGCVAVVVAIAVNTAADAVAGTTFAATVSAPIIEEAMKAAGIVWAWRRKEIDSISDGVIFAGWVALGFAVVEDISYFAQSKSGGELVAVVVVRAILSPFAHPLFTCWTGAAVGVAVSRNKSPFPLILGGYAAAVGLHALWNGSLTAVESADGSSPILLVIPVFLVIFLATGGFLLWLRRKDQRTMEAAVPVLHAKYGLTEAELAVFSRWSSTLASRKSLPRAQRRRFDRLHAGISALGQMSMRPGAIDPIDEARLLNQIERARTAGDAKAS